EVAVAQSESRPEDHARTAVASVSGENMVFENRKDVRAEAPVTDLVRHGETAWSLAGQHTGLTDLPLTPVGEHNAEKLRDAVNHVAFARDVSRPLRRARRL